MTTVMGRGDLMEQSGAAWCEEHDRWECSSNSKRSGSRCHASAIRGTARCKTHAGVPTELAKAKGEANLAAWSTEAAIGADAVDPATAVMDQLRIAQLRANLYGERLRLQLEEEDADGLVGPTYVIGREGQTHESGERVRALADLEAKERDRVVRFAKTAHDMGISEKQIELEQERAALVTSAFAAALAAVSLLPADKQLMLRTFLTGLGRGPEVVEGAIA